MDPDPSRKRLGSRLFSLSQPPVVPPALVHKKNIKTFFDVLKCIGGRCIRAKLRKEHVEMTQGLLILTQNASRGREHGEMCYFLPVRRCTALLGWSPASRPGGPDWITVVTGFGNEFGSCRLSAIAGSLSDNPPGAAGTNRLGWSESKVTSTLLTAGTNSSRYRVLCRG